MKRSVSRLLFASLVALAAVVLPAGSSESYPCHYSWQEGDCWINQDICTGWCTYACPWGDSQGPC